MFLAILAVILLSSTTKYSLASEPLDCTNYEEVTSNGGYYSLDGGGSTSSKKVICFRAKRNSTQRVHLMATRSCDHDYHRRKRLSCDFPNFRVYDGCVEPYKPLQVKCDNCWYDFPRRSPINMWTSTTNCLKVVREWNPEYNKQSFDGVHFCYTTEPKNCWYSHHFPWCYSKKSPIVNCRKHKRRTGIRTRSQRIKPRPPTRRPTLKRRTTPRKTSCSNYTKDQRGVIKSPGYPVKNYSAHLDCTFKIELKENMRIELIFRHVDLVKSKDGKCTDFIEISDGFTSWSTVIQKFCTNSNRPIVSPSNKLKIRFVTNKRTKGSKGFKADYYVYRNPTETDVAQKVTGVVIGTACGLVFLALTFLAICHSKRLTFLHFVQRHYDIQSTGGRDAVQDSAPPSYYDVMASPEKYPITQCSKQKEKCPDMTPEGEGLPTYHRLFTRAEPELEGDVQNSDAIESEIARDVEGTELTHEIEANEATGFQGSEGDVKKGDVNQSDVIGSDVGGNNVRKKGNIKGGSEVKNDITQDVVSVTKEKSDIQANGVKVEDGSKKVGYQDCSRSITTDV